MVWSLCPPRADLGTGEAQCPLPVRARQGEPLRPSCRAPAHGRRSFCSFGGLQSLQGDAAAAWLRSHGMQPRRCCLQAVRP